MGHGVPHTPYEQVLELVGHVLPSALTDLALAMASACIAFSEPTTAGDGRLRDPRQASNGDNVAADNDDEDRVQQLGEGFFQQDEEEETATGAAGVVRQQARLPNDPDSSSVTPATGAPATGEGASTAGIANAEGKGLFRAVSSVDPETTHLNAAFRALETTAVGREGEGEEARLSNGQVTTTGSYCLETRARVLSLPTVRRGRRRRRVVFDVCSADPTTGVSLL